MKIYRKVSRKLDIKKGINLHFTGSMFGLGCSAFDRNGIEQIRRLKKRSDKTGFIVLLPHHQWLDRFKIPVAPELEKLLQQYWPGDLTLILHDKDNTFPHISVDGFIAFRVPLDQLLRDFMLSSDTPIISTSVNQTGDRAENDLTTIINKYGSWFDFGIVPKNVSWTEGKPSTMIKYDGDIKLLREGAIPYEQIQSSILKPRILFVCTANICRSPMADHYTNKILKQQKLNYETASAGFLPSDHPISENSRLVLLENEIDASHHLSSQLNHKIVYESWLILTMTEMHKYHLFERFPNALGKTYTLSEYTGFENDIDDPYGMDIEEYRVSFELIKSRCDELIAKLSEEEV